MKLKFSNITKTYGQIMAVRDVSMEIEKGEFVSLLGASGCGKTTLLRMIAGFSKPDGGTMEIDGKRVDNLPPAKRDVGFVFQSYALFPTQTVAQNIGFSLRVRKRSTKEITDRVDELSDLVRLGKLKDRYPHELSGGQQQRVALARALAPNPSILLLDEPLSALDAQIRAHLRTEIRAITKRLGTTSVYVTHDQDEAMAISDRIAVMNGGEIHQVGAPMDIYLQPKSMFVAEFVGISNSVAAKRVNDHHIEIAGETLTFDIPDHLSGIESYSMSIRPEHIHLSIDTGEASSMTGVVQSFSFLGQIIRAIVAVEAGPPLIVDVPTADWQDIGLGMGSRVTWSIRPNSGVLFARSVQ